MRSARKQKRWAAATMLAMVVSSFGSPAIVPTTVQAQGAPVGAGFTLDAGDVRFIFRQIEIAQAHAGGGDLLGPGPNQVNEKRLPFGLRTVDGSYNHLEEDKKTFGQSDQIFPRRTGGTFQDAEDHVVDLDGPGPMAVGGPSSYKQQSGIVTDSQPRIISNLIVDQTAANPAAVAAAERATGLPAVAIDDSGTLDIPNVAPDVGLSAPFNTMMTFFGQFFDHGLDLVAKNPEEIVYMPLQPDDPLYNQVPPNMRFMVINRSVIASVSPGPDGQMGTDDDVREAKNKTTPFVDQNQTYTSHPSHQVFLREYAMNAQGRPEPTGKMIDGALGNIGNWAEVKSQALTMLGINLADTDVLNVPLIATDPYGHFKPGPLRGMAQLVTPGGLVEGNSDGSVSPNGVGAIRTGHQFLDDIAHNAAPNGTPDADNVVGDIAATMAPGTYDDELLDAHFCTGDGRGNENIALTAVHTVFHAEHNRLVGHIQDIINTQLTADERAAWRAVHGPSGWGYGERLFQAARFSTEMQYQHLVFEEFARKVSPFVNEFIGDGINFQNATNPAIIAEFAHTVYRFGHSMLTETISRELESGEVVDIPLLTAFLNPLAFNRLPDGRTLSAAQAAGAIFEGGTRQVAFEIDEFKTEALRNNLLGLPLDLAAINLARGRSEGIAPLNEVRRQLYAETGASILVPYESWADFQFSMRNPESVVNYIAAYGIHPTLQAETTVAGKRAAATALFLDDPAFMFADGATTGLEQVDLWIGGLAEKQSPFGGLLGSTFNEIFERQLENLQNADRFYYLERLDGLNLLAQLEANSFAELIARNTTANDSFAGDVFARPGLVFNLSAQNATGAIVDDLSTEQDETLELVRMNNGAIRYPGAEHVIWNGSERGDSVVSSEGDDSMKGNGGNDRMEGGSGNDVHIGGDGDDILLDTFGEDVMKGGPGHDVISGGAGPFDLLQGNEGNDFVVGGSDVSEVFGGGGNDVIYTGDGATESFGGGGDDWLESGHQLNLLVGDENNQFQDDPSGGHDVIIGGMGDDDFDSEGGDDIMVAGVLGTDRLEGMLGFDWVTYRGDPSPVDADMSIRVVLAPNLDELRDRFDLTEALSGWNFNDVLRGEDRLAADLAGHELNNIIPGTTQERIVGLGAMLGSQTFTGGNIIIGGDGDDIIEGDAGDDFIDGDAWLNVQLKVSSPAGVELRRANSVHDIKADVIAGTINPRDISIVREIVVAPGPDSDTALFRGNRSEYTISVNAAGNVVVSHTAPAVANVDDGTDTLRRIERMQFADQVVLTTGIGNVAVPNVAGRTQAEARGLIEGAGLVVGTVTNANANTIAFGLAVGTDPLANVGVAPGSTVDLVMSLGPFIPDVHDTTVEDAAAELALSGLVVGQVSEAFNPEIPAGLVATQSPLSGGVIAPGGAVDLFVSKGPAPLGLVMQLSFDTGTATDISGVDNHGTINGATPAAGRIGAGAMSFDGINDMIIVPNSDSLSLETGMTLEAWVNPSARTGWHTVMLKEGVDTFAYEMYSNNPEISRPAAYFMDEAGALRQITGTAVLPLNTWSHLATTWDGTTMRLYVNGLQVRSALRAGPMLATDGQLSIGGNLVWGGEFFAGLMDEVKIYDRALTAAEISADMNGDPLPAPANDPPTAGGDTLSTTAGASVTFSEAALLANDSDPNADPVELLSVSALSTNGGSITTNSEGSWIYTPSAGFSGTDTFTYTVSDGRGGSATGTVTVTVTGPSTGLVLALGFNEAPGATTATDSSGRGNNATTGGATFVASGRTGGGNALSFDGVDDMATVADSDSLDLSSGMTLEAWVRPSNSTGWRTVLLKEAGAQMAYELYSNDATLNRPAGHFTTAGGALRSATGTATLPVNVWSHVAVTYDGTNMRVYVNGALVRNVLRSGTILSSTGVLHLGGNEVWGGEFFQGRMDDVRIYNRALTGAEISTDMNTPLP